MSAIHLDNFGYTIDVVPVTLFEKLKLESIVAKQERYACKNSITEFTSGLTGQGVPKHYYVTKNLEELNKFTLDFFINSYNVEFPDYLKTFKSLSHNVPIVSYDPWFNIQEKHEFIPNHTHNGIASFVIWVNIPYDLKQELLVGEHASTFSFTYSSIIGGIKNKIIPIDKSYEGKIIMFPASLQHCVYPFYTSNDCRISISGNIQFDTSNGGYNAG
jgi:hypothetical protein